MKESYLMIKPDGQRYLPEIEKLIIENDFLINNIYYVEDWEKVSAHIYKKCIEERECTFQQEYIAHVWLNKYLFGNEAIVLMLSKPKIEDEDLLREILKLKKIIRTTFNASKNGTFMVIMDINKIGLYDSIATTGKLCIQTESMTKTLDEMISQVGQFMTFFFQYAHCPDPNVEDAINEINILEQEGVLQLPQLLTKKEWNLMKHYRSLRR